MKEFRPYRQLLCHNNFFGSASFADCNICARVRVCVCVCVREREREREREIML
jgi:hypothetical protein